VALSQNFPSWKFAIMN